jgi:phosphatidate cytidylyltransferase
MVGGMVLSLTLVFFYDKIIDFLAARFHNDNWFGIWTYTNYQWLAIGFVTLVFATYGDLVESMLKRSLGIKDSGTFLPGHGGFLDRLDAILIALPSTLVIVFIIDRINDILLLIDFLK